MKIPVPAAAGRNIRNAAPNRHDYKQAINTLQIVSVVRIPLNIVLQES